MAISSKNLRIRLEIVNIILDDYKPSKFYVKFVWRGQKFKTPVEKGKIASTSNGQKCIECLFCSLGHKAPNFLLPYQPGNDDSIINFSIWVEHTFKHKPIAIGTLDIPSKSHFESDIRVPVEGQDGLSVGSISLSIHVFEVDDAVFQRDTQVRLAQHQEATARKAQMEKHEMMLMAGEENHSRLQHTAANMYIPPGGYSSAMNNNMETQMQNHPNTMQYSGNGMACNPLMGCAINVPNNQNPAFNYASYIPNNSNNVNNPYQIIENSTTPVTNPYQVVDNSSHPITNPYQVVENASQPVTNPYQVVETSTPPITNPYQVVENSAPLVTNSSSTLKRTTSPTLSGSRPSNKNIPPHAFPTSDPPMVRAAEPLLISEAKPLKVPSGAVNHEASNPFPESHESSIQLPMVVGHITVPEAGKTSVPPFPVSDEDEHVSYIRTILPTAKTSDIIKALKDNGWDREKAIDVLLSAAVENAVIMNSNKINIGQARDPPPDTLQGTSWLSCANSIKGIMSNSPVEYGLRPVTVSPSRPLPPTHIGQRKALLIGINYKGTSSELRGCVNDVLRMKVLLCSLFGFVDNPYSMVVLRDDAIDPNYMPTRQNILAAARWLTIGNNPGDCFFFHYSGHGDRQIDKKGIESDGYDETILPVDFSRCGHIVDDELHEYLVQPLHNSTRLTAVMDCCHSGTGLDLSYIWNRSKWTWEEETNPFYVMADVQLFSGCSDHETSADVRKTASTASGGAMTTAFITALTASPYGHTYPSLMEALNQSMIERRIHQSPQMTSSQRFDFSRPFSLTEAQSNSNKYLGRQIRRVRRLKESTIDVNPTSTMLHTLRLGHAALNLNHRY